MEVKRQGRGDNARFQARPKARATYGVEGQRLAALLQ